MSDMAISGVVGRNCALWRVIKDEAVCKDYTPEEQRQLALNREEIARGHPNVILMTDAESSYLYPGASANPSKSSSAADFVETDMPKSDTKAGTLTLPPAPPSMAMAAQEHEGGSVAHVAGAPVRVALSGTKIADSRTTTVKVARAQRHGTYLVLASFSNHANAERARGLYQQTRPSFAVAVVDDRSFHRVVSGPFAPSEIAKARMRIEKALGIHDAWVLPACTGPEAADPATLACAGGDKIRLATLN